MGTANTYKFKCPNCDQLLYTQGHGSCETLDLATTCQCNIVTIEDNEEICSKCGVVINFIKEKCLKRVDVLIPQTKDAS